MRPTVIYARGVGGVGGVRFLLFVNTGEPAASRATRSLDFPTLFCGPPPAGPDRNDAAIVRNYPDHTKTSIVLFACVSSHLAPF